MLNRSRRGGLRVRIFSKGKAITATLLTDCNNAVDTTPIDQVNTAWECYQTGSLAGPQPCGPSATRAQFLCSTTGAGFIDPSGAASTGGDNYRYLANYEGDEFSAPLTAERMEIEWDIETSGSQAADAPGYIGLALFTQPDAGDNPYNPAGYFCGVNTEASGPSGGLDNMRLWEALSTELVGFTPGILATQSLGIPANTNSGTLKFIASRSGSSMNLQGFWDGTLIVQSAATEAHTAGRVGIGIWSPALGTASGKLAELEQESGTVRSISGGGGVGPIQVDV